MDCVIPSHGVRTFSAAVACLGKVGKELYVDFDPLDGLTLRTINDAKSAYGTFRFAPNFFERCAAPPRAAPATRGEGGRGAGGGSSSSKRDRTGRSGNGRSLGSSDRDALRGGQRRRRRRRLQWDEDGSRVDGDDAAGRGGDDESDGRGDDDDDDDDGRYTCRVPVRTVHAVLRPRKGVRSLRVRSNGGGMDSGGGFDFRNGRRNWGNDGGKTDEEKDAVDEEEGMLMQLSFEFRIENSKTGSMMKVVHRVGVADANGIAAFASLDGCSEIVSGPGVLLRMLEPLKRTAEVALTIDDDAKVVTATSFHHGDAFAAIAGSAENALLSAANAAVLKTETSIGVDEFEEYNFKDDRDGPDGSHCNDVLGGSTAPPADINEVVTLVFSIKEAKAMLHFCAHADPEEEMRTVVSYHWGGRPITLDAKGAAFNAKLIMATLDHKLLGRSARKSSGRNEAKQNG